MNAFLVVLALAVQADGGIHAPHLERPFPKTDGGRNYLKSVTFPITCDTTHV